MKRPYARVLVLTACLTTVFALGAGAQEPSPPAPPASPEPAPVVAPDSAKRALVPLEVRVVISRYQGEKKVSSMPYVLAVNANSGNSQLNMGAEVPIPMMASTGSSEEGAKVAPVTSFNYQTIGTSIDCVASTVDEGRYELTVAVDESSVLAEAGGREVSSVKGVPVLRKFRSRNRLLLRDGQTRQYTAATDRVNGETVRIDVTLNVVK
jgi:Bacterial type II and III secretion system protein